MLEREYAIAAYHWEGDARKLAEDHIPATRLGEYNAALAELDKKHPRHATKNTDNL